MLLTLILLRPKVATNTNTNKNLYSAKFVDKNETEALSHLIWLPLFGDFALFAVQQKVIAIFDHYG